MTAETTELTHESQPYPEDIEGRDGISSRGVRVTDTDFELAAAYIERHLRADWDLDADTTEMEGNRRMMQHALDSLASGSGGGDLKGLMAQVRELATKQRCDLTDTDLAVLGKDGASAKLAEWDAAARVSTEERKAALIGRIEEETDPTAKAALEDRLVSLDLGDPTMLEDAYIDRTLNAR